MVTSLPGLGLALPAEGTSLSASLRLARLADELGYGAISVAERNDWELFASAAALAQVTQRARIVTAIASVYTRPPALLAMGAATVQDLAAGRFVLGLGSSSEPITRRWMGLAFDRPYTRLAETLAVVPRILAGERTDEDGQTLSTHGFRLGIPTVGHVPIHLASLGPRTAELAGRSADGAILNMVCPDGAGAAARRIRLAAEAAGREAAPEVSLTVPLVLTGAGRSHEAGRRLLAGLAASYAQVEVYRRHLHRLGIGPTADRVARRWRSGDRTGAVAAVDDHLLAAAGAVGTIEDCAARLAAYLDAGLDRVNAYLIPAPDDGGEPNDGLAGAVSDLHAAVAGLMDRRGHRR